MPKSMYCTYVRQKWMGCVCRAGLSATVLVQKIDCFFLNKPVNRQPCRNWRQNATAEKAGRMFVPKDCWQHFCARCTTGNHQGATTVVGRTVWREQRCAAAPELRSISLRLIDWLIDSVSINIIASRSYCKTNKNLLLPRDIQSLQYRSTRHQHNCDWIIIIICWGAKCKQQKNRLAAFWRRVDHVEKGGSFVAISSENPLGFVPRELLQGMLSLATFLLMLSWLSIWRPNFLNFLFIF